MLDALWPTDCGECGSPLEHRQRHGICLDCWAGIRAIRPPACAGCGLPVAGPRGSGAPGSVCCASCATHPLGTDGTRACVLYAGAARTIVRRAKRRRRPEPFTDMGRWISALVRGAAWSNVDRIVPVPGAPWPTVLRGFDPAERIATATGRDLGVPVAARAIRRPWTSPGPVKGLAANERERVLRGALRAAPAEIEGRHVLLVDDVLTTGATVRECTRALRAGGARTVRVACWARTPV